ncbi:hypothetical protein TorRG33x02_349910 [Trema orientale]|uniref:Uncharacterized protein n=1 Tax=Trema orientale TaxID=63057 RepID=A0A2P5AI06_TREOI|nr:hypothetical protein TorRG33x02_349910 [Trema orientale]
MEKKVFDPAQLSLCACSLTDLTLFAGSLLLRLELWNSTAPSIQTP